MRHYLRQHHLFECDIVTAIGEHKQYYSLHTRAGWTTRFIRIARRII